jgi:hypothetical protein
MVITDDPRLQLAEANGTSLGYGGALAAAEETILRRDRVVALLAAQLAECRAKLSEERGSEPSQQRISSDIGQQDASELNVVRAELRVARASLHALKAQLSIEQQAKNELDRARRLIDEIMTALVARDAQILSLATQLRKHSLPLILEYFDVDTYREQNPDIASIDPSDCAEHWIDHGYAEHRVAQFHIPSATK